MAGTVRDCASTPTMTPEITATHVETSHCGVSTIQHQASPQDVARYVSTSGTLLEGISNVETLRATSPTHHINPGAKQSPVGTQGHCIHRCAKVETQRIAFPSDYAYATGVQRCDTGADVRAVRPYKPHPSHAVLCYTVSMEGTVGDCTSMPAMTREVTTTNVETLRATSPTRPAPTQGCIKRKRVLLPCPAGLDPASHPVKMVGTQRVALDKVSMRLRVVARKDKGCDGGQ